MAALNAGAPRITDHLCDACAEHFAAVRAHLDALGRAVSARARASCAASTTTRARRSSSTSRREGQQQALGGGGRYDGLVELLGGQPTPGIGFGIGLDRVVLALDEQGGQATADRPRPRSSSVRPGRHRRRACASRRSCAPPASQRGRSSAAASSASSSSRRPATGRPLRGHRRRRAGRRRRPAARPAGRHAEGRRRSPTSLARSLERTPRIGTGRMPSAAGA